MIDKILGESYNLKAIRRDKNLKTGKIDQATIIEDEDTQEKQIKFKSDGKTIPKPSDLSLTNVKYQGITHKILGGWKRTDMIEVVEDGDETKIVKITGEEENYSAETAEKEHLFATHRNFLAKKTVEAWNMDDDNTQMWLAAYLSVLALVTLGGMYMIVNGIESAVVEGVTQGIETAWDATGEIENPAEGGE